MSLKSNLQTGASVCVLSFMVFMGIKSTETDEFLLSEGKSTTMVITSLGSKAVWISYTVDGKEYRHRESTPFGTIYPTESFKLLYDPDDPSSNLVLFTDPVLPEGRSFDSCFTESISPHPFGSSKIEFEYRINGKLYDRWQKVKTGDVDLSKKYLVKYRIDRPEIAYIFFDEQ